MFFKSREPAETQQPKPSPAIGRITDDARALRPLTASLYYACVQERLHAKDTELSAISIAMDQAQSEGFAAAVRLMSLDATERVVFGAFTELSGDKGDGQ